jgi:cysteine desulfurase / selenocysteine lyase
LPWPMNAAAPNSSRGFHLLEQVRRNFMGLRTTYPVAEGGLRPRCYLDSAASTLMMAEAHEVGKRFLAHYANTHSRLHYGASIATDSYQWAHEKVLSFTGADADRYQCIFTGSGSTSGLNHVARLLTTRRPSRDLVLVSRTEHHSNDLPHRRHAGRVIHFSGQCESDEVGASNLELLQEAIETHGSKVNYVAVSGASNVTGIINPIHEIAVMAHRVGALIVVDASQLVGHAPFKTCEPNHPESDIDFVVFSGHKVYAPGSPGVIVGLRSVLTKLEPDDLGGGTVDAVYLNRYELTDALPDRHEAGTPNVLGAVTLGIALEILERIGVDLVYDESNTLVQRALVGLSQLDRVRLYGDTDLSLSPRTGIISFNLEGIDHGMVAAALNDYHNVAVRNECFCAQPYVRDLLKSEPWAVGRVLDQFDLSERASLRSKMGMVRASFGLYTTPTDIDALIDGVRDITERREYFRSVYQPDAEGNYRRRKGVSSQGLFDPLEALDQVLSERRPAQSATTLPL